MKALRHPSKVILTAAMMAALFAGCEQRDQTGATGAGTDTTSGMTTPTEPGSASGGGATAGDTTAGSTGSGITGTSPGETSSGAGMTGTTPGEATPGAGMGTTPTDPATGTSSNPTTGVTVPWQPDPAGSGATGSSTYDSGSGAAGTTGTGSR